MMDAIPQLCQSVTEPEYEYYDFSQDYPLSDFSSLTPSSPSITPNQATFQSHQPVTQSHPRPADLFSRGNPNFSPQQKVNTPHKIYDTIQAPHINGHNLSPMMPPNHIPRNSSNTTPDVHSLHANTPHMSPGNVLMSHSIGEMVSPIFNPQNFHKLSPNYPRNALSEVSNISPVLLNGELAVLHEPQITLPTPPPRRNSGVAPSPRHMRHSLPHSHGFQSDSKLAQRLKPLGCVFKEGWVATCEGSTEGEELTEIIRRCLDTEKVRGKKPQELSTILDSAMLTDDEKAKVLEIRRKVMRQKNRQARSNGVANPQA